MNIEAEIGVIASANQRTSRVAPSHQKLGERRGRNSSWQPAERNKPIGSDFGFLGSRAVRE